MTSRNILNNKPNKQNPVLILKNDFDNYELHAGTGCQIIITFNNNDIQ